MKHYHQLTQEQRYQIGPLRATGKSQRWIAAFIGVNHNTISRELSRNSTAQGYQAKTAEALSQARKRSAAKAGKRNESMDKIIVEKLLIGWSPGSISERLKREKTASIDQLSHTSIYRMIAQDKASQGHLYLYLPNTARPGGKAASVTNNRVLALSLIVWTLQSVLLTLKSASVWVIGKVIQCMVKRPI